MSKRTILALVLALSLAFSIPVSAVGTDMSVPTGETVTDGDSVPGSDEEDRDTTVSDGDMDLPSSSEDLSGKKVNLALIVDTTGSMSGAINNVRENLAEFVRYIGTTGAKFRIALIDYRDITEGEKTVVHTFDHSAWSEDILKFIQELESLYADGGGDWEESVVDALGYLLDEATMTFNSDAAKFAIVVTDAPYKEENSFGYESMDEVISSLVKSGIKVSVMTSPECYDYYEELTNKTGGILCSIDGNFADSLMEYAESIIASTADSEIEDVKAVTGINASGPASIRPEYVYQYKVEFTPTDATDKGLYWYIDNTSVAELVSASGTTCRIRGVKEGTTTLTAVSKDGGYTSSINIEVNGTADISSEYISSDYDSIKEVLGIDSVKVLEYRVTAGTEVSSSEQGEIFSTIKGTDKTFSFAFIDSENSTLYKWSFLGSDITDAGKVVNFNIVVNPDNKVVTDAVDEDVEEVDLHFAHSGSLPGKAAIDVNVGSYISADKLYLYYYNPATSKLELVASDIPLISGHAVFPLDHCSDYVLTAAMLRSLVPIVDETNETNKPDESNESEKDDNDISNESTPATTSENLLSPKTGEETPFEYWYLFIMTAILGYTALGYCIKKNKSSN